MADASAPDLILHHGHITTLDRANPTASAVAIRDGRFIAVGRDHEVLPLAGPASRVIDLQGRSVLPGLIDNHLHIIRGGLNFNLELRWDGVKQPGRRDGHAEARKWRSRPAPQWVRVVGGFTEHQFAEKRLPTHRAELNAVAPDTPVFILHLYDRALLNGAALRAVGYTKRHAGTARRPDHCAMAPAIPLACCWPSRMRPSCTQTLSKGPKLPLEYQVNSTRHFMRELNRLGVTGAIDAGGGFQNYPEDYQVIQQLSDAKPADDTPGLQPVHAKARSTKRKTS